MIFVLVGITACSGNNEAANFIANNPEGALGLVGGHGVNVEGPLPTPSPLGDPARVALGGVVNGGGGAYEDTYAYDAMVKVKTFLAHMIRLSNDGIYSKFPEGKRKEFILDLVENISHQEGEPKRDGKRLRFNYDNVNNKLFFTDRYIATFPYGRFKNMSTSQKDRIIYEIMFDLIREISHFYGIGISLETDSLSDDWALNFILVGLGSNLVVCENPDQDFALYFHRPTGIGTLLSSSSPEAKDKLEKYRSEEIEFQDFLNGALLAPFAFGDEFYMGNQKRSKRFVDKFDEVIASLSQERVDGLFTGDIAGILPLQVSEYENRNPELNRAFRMGTPELVEESIRYSHYSEGFFTAHEKGGPAENLPVEAKAEARTEAIYNPTDNLLTYTSSRKNIFKEVRDQELYGDVANVPVEIDIPCFERYEEFNQTLTE